MKPAGVIAFINKNKLFASTKFYNSMHFGTGGHGLEILERLNAITTPDEFKDFIGEINDKYYHLPDDVLIKTDNLYTENLDDILTAIDTNMYDVLKMENITSWRNY